jgi:glutathione S-transferase
MKLYDTARAPHPRRVRIADIARLVGLDFMKASRLAVPEDLAHVRRWHAKLSARPNAQA